MPQVESFHRLEELTAFVHRRLCAQDHLDPQQTPLIRQPLLCRGRPCGAVFHREGPRELRTSAVWAGAEDRILFYDSTGRKIHEVEFLEAPAPASCL